MTASWTCCGDLILTAGTEAPYWARRSTENMLGAWKIADPERMILLLVSELVTNAVAVSGPGDPVRLRLTVLENRLRVTVWDRCSHPPAAGPDLPEGEGGRGLRLVEALTASWGWAREPGGGKYVWCEYVWAD
ncbi:MAG: ATP-binding protein [Streptosporangiaceae bacterium]